MKKITQIIISVLLSGILGFVISQLVLPPFFAIYNPLLDSLSLLDRSSLITYAGVLITVGGSFIVAIIFNRFYNFKQMIMILLLSLFSSMILLGYASYAYVGLKYPESIENTTLFLRLVKVLSYPVIISLKIADPQPMWIISITIFLIFFSLSIMKLTEEI